MKIEEMAVLLVAAARNELALGTKHYDRDGKLLETPVAIIDALSGDGLVLKPTKEREHLFREIAEEYKKASGV